MLDAVDFKVYLPLFVILFLVIGWLLATGVDKGQYVRLFDVLLYGPYFIYLAMKDTYTFSIQEKMFLLFVGTTTVSYNLRNFLGGL
jgi:hypothetical protein